MLDAARALFSASDIEVIQIVDVAKAAGVSTSTVYAIFKSKAGIVRALMEQTLFGRITQSALSQIEGESDPVRLIELTPEVARAIYEGETRELGRIRDLSASSPMLRELEREFEQRRFEMQEKRIVDLFACGRGKRGLDIETARRILWMYTSRDIYRMLVTEGGWSPEAYEKWLRSALVTTLIEPAD